MPSLVMPASRHGWLKLAIFALLAWNTAAYAVDGTSNEALDAAAWFLLLVLFTLETDFGAHFRGRSAATAIRGARLAAALAVCAAAAGYVREEEWLDAVNSALWIGMVVVLELQVRRRDAPGRLLAGAAVLLCLGLAGLVTAWLLEGAWFDAYDAALWLVALVVVELTVLHARPAEG